MLHNFFASYPLDAQVEYPSFSLCKRIELLLELPYLLGREVIAFREGPSPAGSLEPK